MEFTMKEVELEEVASYSWEDVEVRVNYLSSIIEENESTYTFQTEEIDETITEVTLILDHLDDPANYYNRSIQLFIDTEDDERVEIVDLKSTSEGETNVRWLEHDMYMTYDEEWTVIHARGEWQGAYLIDDPELSFTELDHWKVLINPETMAVRLGE
ncbi:hypothetical protein [Geomicrobium sp. JCM 19055]|uniref:hypothetical protein n=1 Tax=Geomicrobium sp. JCM 19055 TaxID=1460649 RepID=UPI0005AA5D40|nr:hypothetical protein [Geomicrobium sp. JCM 19055]